MKSGGKFIEVIKKVDFPYVEVDFFIVIKSSFLNQNAYFLQTFIVG